MLNRWVFGTKWVIGIKWVFRNKVDEHEMIVRNKAKIVDQGFNQEECIDYEETFTPVARLKAIRMLLAYARYKDIRFSKSYVSGPCL